MPVGRQPEDDACAAQHQHPARHFRLSADLTGVRQRVDDGRQRAHGVGHVVGAVGKGHGGGREDLGIAEYTLDVTKPVRSTRLGG